MTVLQEPAWAKLNLALDVGALRPDGFHEMRMVMQSVSLHDDVTLRLGTGRWWAEGPAALPHDERNLALRAARVFCQTAGIAPDGVEVALEKRIPSCAGLAGGSADAAAVLRALQRHYGAPLSRAALLDAAGQVGSDVPFCLLGGTQLAEGRGERLTPLLPLPDCAIVICKPDFGSSTPALFRALDAAPPQRRPDFGRILARLGNPAALGPEMENVFEPLLTDLHPELAALRQTLLDCGALGAMLTGTGSAMFGLFASDAAAERARTALLTQVPWAVLARPVGAAMA